MFGLRVRLTIIVATAALSLPACVGWCTPPDLYAEYPQAAAVPNKRAEHTSGALDLPPTFDRHLGDLDGMVKRRRIRALVVPSRSGFFYDKGQPRGIFYEAMEEFQRFANLKLKTGSLKIHVTYIPVRGEQIQTALLEGVGDVLVYGSIVTPEREKVALFTTPIATHAKQVIVTGPKSSPVTRLEDLSGKEIYVNPLTDFYGNLQHLSEAFQKAGKAPILVKAADPNLRDEDLLEMVNAGLIPATVTLDGRAEFWSKVLPNLTLHQDIVLKDDGQLAWVTRKDSPHLKQLLDKFIQGHRLGTSFGNTLLRRYLQNTKWVKDSTSTEEMKKFQAYVGYFQKYAAEYDFDYLMLVAQGYQESLLDQNRKNPSGAVGIMQVIPKYAAAAPINISDVHTAEGNIQAGAKMLRNIADTYFKDDKLDPLNKTLMVFASYNAGPTRIARLRKTAATEGLDPNQWFGNVELVVANGVGQETVQYVSNIYKYYVAYKLTLEQSNRGK
jgi:membrane-bound lytic murein transglycosylase MltF